MPRQTLNKTQDPQGILFVRSSSLGSIWTPCQACFPGCALGPSSLYAGPMLGACRTSPGRAALPLPAVPSVMPWEVADRECPAAWAPRGIPSEAEKSLILLITAKFSNFNTEPWLEEKLCCFFFSYEPGISEKVPYANHSNLQNSAHWIENKSSWRPKPSHNSCSTL